MYNDDNKINGVSFDNSKKLTEYYNDQLNVQNFEKLQLGMTLEELKVEFEKFKGNYAYSITQFDSMSERDQKLFILYSIFHFGLYFHIEKIESFVTEQVVRETRVLANEFANYGSHTGCAIHCYISLDGPTISGVGYNVSGSIKSEQCIRKIDSLSLEDLARIANDGYSYNTEEESIFQSLDKKRNDEITAFYDLLSTLIQTKIR